jgi:phospholipase/carboxylesterase
LTGLLPLTGSLTSEKTNGRKDRSGYRVVARNQPVKQLFVLLHRVGANSSDLVPLANKLREAFPNARFLLPDGTVPFDGGGGGRQWFSLTGVTEENRASRVAAAILTLHALVREAKDRFNVLQSDTARVGFSQGAIMALEFSIDGGVGRVLAFSGRIATLPEEAPDLTTLHLLHGEDDQVISVEHAYASNESISSLHGDATLDVASSVGHEIQAALSARAIDRLQTCIPLRTWKRHWMVLNA